MHPAPRSETLGTAEIGRMLADVRSLTPAVDDADRIERLRQFEELKSAIAAAQLLEASQFDTSQRVEQATLGVPSARQGRGIAGQVGLAMRTSPYQATRWLGWAKVLTRELPVTFEALRAGRTSEWRALLMARETVWLTREDRAEVDSIVGGELERLSDARVEAEAKKHAHRLDPAGAAERRRVAVRQRRVTVRPMPDTMSCLSAVTSVEQGVAAYAALRRAADTMIGIGENNGRTRDQVMADLLIARVTGRADVASAEAPGPVDVAVELLIPVDTLLGTDTDDTSEADGSDDGALLTTPGLRPFPIPGNVAREIVAAAPHAWLRRLFTAPLTGALVAMESRQRLFPDGLRDFLRYRDQYCSTPHCGAAIRHIDHAVPAEDGGPTNDVNGNGKCAACNWAKQAPGWRQDPAPGGRGTITTPTGHRYDLGPPLLPGPRRRRGTDHSPLVDVFWNALRAA